MVQSIYLAKNENWNSIRMENNFRKIIAFVTSIIIFFWDMMSFAAEMPWLPNWANFTPESTSWWKSAIWEKAWIDFFSTLDSWSYKFKKNMLNVRLKWKTSELNNYLLSSWQWCWDWSKEVCFDEWKDFTQSEIVSIIQDWNTKYITDKLKSDFVKDGLPIMSDDRMRWLITQIKDWYDKKLSEVARDEKSMISIWTTWLYQDWDVGNSWYDIIDDLNNIHKVIFASEVKYNWDTNNSSSEWSSIENWMTPSPSAVFKPNEYWDNVNSWDLWENWAWDAWGWNWWENNNNNGTNSNWDWGGKSKNPLVSESNKCSSWSLWSWDIDAGLLSDIQSQLTTWEWWNSVTWWQWNSNWENWWANWKKPIPFKTHDYESRSLHLAKINGEIPP